MRAERTNDSRSEPRVSHRLESTVPRIPIVCLIVGGIVCASPATSARLEQVIDLVDQGTPLALDSLAARSWSQGRIDGRITLVNASPGPPRLYGVYVLDPAAGTSVQLATVDPSNVASMLSGVLPIPTPTGDVYFVIEDVASGVQQDLYRLEGTVLAPVLDLTAAGVEVGFVPLAHDTVWGGGSFDGIVRVVSRVNAASNQFHVVEIDPSIPAAAVVSQLQTMTEFPTVRPAFDPAGAVYLVLSEHPEPMEPPSERLYRVDGDTLTEVADVRGAGFQLHLAGATTGDLTANVTSTGTVQALLRPDGFSDFTLLEIDPASGATTLRTTVRPSSVFDGPGQLPSLVGAHPAFGLDGASFFVIGDDTILDPRQGLFRNRFRSSTTRVVDITAQGVTVEAGPTTIPIGVALDSSIRVSVPHPFANDLRRLYRFDPVSGLAFPPVTADLADTGSSPLLAYTAFGPGGEVYYVVSDGGMPPQQGVWRFDDGPLTEVVDVTAAGIEINPAGAIFEPSLGVADDGTIQLFDPHPLLGDVYKLFRFDPSDGSAETLATLDLALLVTGPIEAHAEAFAPGGELYVLVDTMGFPSRQQTVYRRDGATLVPVADLTAQGIELGTGAGLTPLQAAARADGMLRIVDLDPGSMSTRRVHSVDTSTGEAWLEAMLDTQVLCCGDLAGTTPILTELGREDDLYLLDVGDGASRDPQQSIFRLRLAPEPTTAVLQLAAFGIVALLARSGRRRAPGS